jgi:hypothetical protein
VNAAGGHALARVQNHPRGFVVAEAFGATRNSSGTLGCGNFGAPPKPPWRVVGRLENGSGVAQCVRRQQEI